MLDFIVNVDKANADTPLLRGAFALARRQQAFLTGLQLVAVYPSLMAVTEVMSLLDAEERDALARRDWWLDLCRQAGVTGEWEVIRGVYVAALAKRSRLADLVITELRASASGTPAGFDEITRALFADGAPMLLVPDTWPGELQAQRMLIAWNGSGEAARAIKAALPLLAQATEVRVLDGEQSGLPGINLPPLPLRSWLQRHGINAQWQPFPVEREAGKAMLEECRAMQADLLVMGAWGHSRISEWVLGGVTRHMLEHTQLPLLLAH